MITGTDAVQNSARNCLHMPHGEQNDDGDDDDDVDGDDNEEDIDGTDVSLLLPGPGRSDATATARISPGRTPAAMAAPTATRSAHIPTG